MIKESKIMKIEISVNLLVLKQRHQLLNENYEKAIASGVRGGASEGSSR
jgi:hypothetical protein